MPDPSPESMEPIPPELARDDAAFAALVEGFIQNLADRVEAIEQAAQSNDLKRVQALARQLRGASSGCGYQAVIEKAAALEEHAVEARLASVAADLEELKAVISRVVSRTD